MYDMQYNYDEKTGRVSIEGLPFKAKLLEPPEEKQFNKIRSYTLHQRDLIRVECCLDLYNKTEKDDDVKRRIFFSEAIISYMRCFSSGKRTCLQKSAIYKDEKRKKEHDDIEILRNKIIAHDEAEFSIVPLEIVYNDKSKRIEGVGCIPGRIILEYDENVLQLRELTKIAQAHVSKIRDEELLRLSEYFSHKTNEEIEKYEEMTISFK